MAVVNFPVIDLGNVLEEWGNTSRLLKRNLLFQNPSNLGQQWSLLSGEVLPGISLQSVDHVILQARKQPWQIRGTSKYSTMEGQQVSTI